jgi:glycosyltransferase involved in cell wall biosynthesis
LTKVLHIDAGNLFGGVETFLLTLARNREMCPTMEPEFALCFEGPVSEMLMKSGVLVHQLGAVRVRNPWSVFRARQELTWLLSKHSPDVVACHMPWVYALFAPVVRKTDIPVMLWLHSTFNAKHWVERWATLTNPNLVICNSQYTQSTLTSVLPRMKSTVIYYPVEQSSKVICGDRAAIRRELETSVDNTVIVQISRLERWKGQALHLEALSALREIPGWTCWMVGGAQRHHESLYLRELERRTEELGLSDRVRFLGHRSDVADILRAADIYCQPNTAPEPFGIVFVEALQAGLPVVLSATGAAMEVISDECAIAVPAGDPVALGHALQRLIEDRALRARLSDAAPARAAQISDVGLRMRDIGEALSSLVAKRDKRGEKPGRTIAAN